MLNEFAEESHAEVIVGDACDPPPSLMREHFDLVFSNSVIEHVGGHSRRERFADAVRSLGTHFWVQTPYRYFPIEPHFLSPASSISPPMSALTSSDAGRSAITPESSPKLSPGDPVPSRDRTGSSITAMRGYFPDSEIVLERSGPHVKSLIPAH